MRQVDVVYSRDGGGGGARGTMQANKPFSLGMWSTAIHDVWSIFKLA